MINRVERLTMIESLEHVAPKPKNKQTEDVKYSFT